MVDPDAIKALKKGAKAWAHYIAERPQPAVWDFSGIDFRSIETLSLFDVGAPSTFANAQFNGVSIPAQMSAHGLDLSNVTVDGNAQLSLGPGSSIVKIHDAKFRADVSIIGHEQALDWANSDAEGSLTLDGIWNGEARIAGPKTRLGHLVLSGAHFYKSPQIQNSWIGPQESLKQRWLRRMKDLATTEFTPPTVLSSRNALFDDGLSFRHVTINGAADFSGAKFGGGTDFRRTVFRRAPAFHGAAPHQETEFDPVEMFDRQFPDTSSRGSEQRYRTLKQLMMNNNALGEQLGFARLEMKVHRRKLGLINLYRMYHHFEIAKGKNKTRVISAPDPRLKDIQRKIAGLLDQMYQRRDPVHGFVVDRSVKTNAQSHLRGRFVLNVDLKAFFPSITERRVYGMLSSLGVDDRVAKILARLCCNNGELPQGAPSSPVLSNMICFRLDKQLFRLAKNARCIYTRYADDITFSSYQPLTALFEGPVPPAGQFSPDLLAVSVRNAFAGNGFAINPEKAHYADRHSRRTVTGLKVNELLNVDRRFVRNIRAALHSVETLGDKKAQEVFESKYGGSCTIAAHLAGKISWLGHIRGQSDPVLRSIALRFNSCFPDRKLNVTPTPAEIRDRSVWIVEHPGGDHGAQGTAFFLKDVGLVTAAHCVTNAANIEVYHPDKPANKFKVSVSKIDDHRDLALLKYEIPGTEYFELSRSTAGVAVGQQLTAIGYPGFGPGDRINVRTGTVTSMPMKSAVQMIEVSQKLAQGMSGGPVLDGADAVAGIIHKGGPGEARDFAIHIHVLNDWLK